LTTFYAIGLGFDITYFEYFGEAWCNIPWFVGVFGVCYRTIGSLGIAIVRLLLIKNNALIKKCSKNKLSSIVLMLSFAITACLVIGFKTGNGPGSRKQVTWNWCVGKSETFREAEHEYYLAIGKVSDESELVSMLCLLVTFVGNVAELCCYLIFFGHVYSHDRGLMKRKVLKDAEFKRRRQKNAMTFMEQFYGFVFECLTYIGVWFTSFAGSNISYRLAMAIGFWAEFGIISFVEVVTSQNLRERLPHNLYSR